MTRPIRNSAKALIIRNGCVLAIRNIDADGDWYILPGGGQERGETLHDALRRECLEEIGALVTVGDLKLVREYIGRNHEFGDHDGDVHQVEFMFEGSIDTGYTPANGSAPDTHQTGVAWLPLDDLDRFRIYPAALKTVLKNGLAAALLAYMGDVN